MESGGFELSLFIPVHIISMTLLLLMAIVLSTRTVFFFPTLGLLRCLKLLIVHNPVLTSRVGMCLAMGGETAGENTTIVFSETRRGVCRQEESAESHAEREGGGQMVLVCSMKYEHQSC